MQWHEWRCIIWEKRVEEKKKHRTSHRTSLVIENRCIHMISPSQYCPELNWTIIRPINKTVIYAEDILIRLLYYHCIHLNWGIKLADSLWTLRKICWDITSIFTFWVQNPPGVNLAFRHFLIYKIPVLQWRWCNSLNTFRTIVGFGPDFETNICT